MKIFIDKKGSIEGLKQMLLEAEVDDSVEAIMILTCESNNFTPSNSDSLFKKITKPIFGGIFPQILIGSENLSQGTIVAGLSNKVKPFVIKNISHPDINFDILLSGYRPTRPSADKTIFLFMDGMSSNISALLDSTFNHLGLISGYIGGGAGSATFKQMPCIITSSGLLQDAAVFAFAEIGSGIGVAHGWHPVSEPFKITSSNSNTLHSLGGKPAYEVYRQIVANVSNTNVDEFSFDAFAKKYPFGVVKIADELLVRDPVKCDGASIEFLGELPLNSFVYVLKGDVQSLLAGAKKSRSIAEEVYNQRTNKSNEITPVTFFIDCITRAQFLGENFKDELEIASGGARLIGALTLGEIANSGHDYLEFYNKTSVIGLLED
jgi:hypothetical protein